jgi:solute carrier family 10 (sodium/bile acid cotransporter), member 7
MLQWLRRRWFLVGLLVLIPAGLALGAQLPSERLQRIAAVVEGGATAWLVAAILFLMSFSLDSRQIGRALTRPGPVLLACVINFGVLPLIAWPLMKVQLLSDYAIGLMIAASVPTTMAAASVWTRKAGGNDAVSLLVTLLTNGLCFLVTPLWLGLAVASSFEFDLWQMIRRLIYTALLPALAGQLARLVPRLRLFVNDHKVAAGVLAQAFILVIVFSAALLKMGPQLQAMNGGSGGLLGLLVVWVSGMAVHLAAMGIGWRGGHLLGFDRRDCIAIAFAGSQKTLPIGLLIATDPSMAGVPFAVFPMLMYHASQLFLDTAIADRMALGNLTPARQPLSPAALEESGPPAEKSGLPPDKNLR